MQVQESIFLNLHVAVCIIGTYYAHNNSWVGFLPPPQVLQSDGLAMEEELCRLRSQVELQRMQTTVIATLEGERAALERDRDALRSSVDALRSAQRKVGNSYQDTQSYRYICGNWRPDKKQMTIGLIVCLSIGACFQII